MKFVKTQDLEMGTIIARPMYNKKGVLLYNIGATVDATMITNFQNAEMYGTYILDPSEPLPVISDEEMAFVGFQSVNYFVVEGILKAVIAQKPLKELDALVDQIYHKFGFIKRKILFHQSIRSENDFVSKHSLNVAVLSAMISEKMKFENKEKKYLIQGALFHDIGKLLVDPKILHKRGKLTTPELSEMHRCILEGYDLLGKNYSYQAAVRRYLIQLSRDMSKDVFSDTGNQKLLPGTKIIQVADIYDTLTAIRPYKDPMSGVQAFLIMRSEPDKYDPQTVDALEECLNLLPTGSYVKMSNGEEGIVIQENPASQFHPRVLGLGSNKIYDLSDRDLKRTLTITGAVFTSDDRPKIAPERVKELMSKAGR